MSENSLLKSYIKSDHSPNGKWWVEVPVGFEIRERGAPLKFVDAVCLTSEPNELPESWPEFNGGQAFMGTSESGVTRVEMFDRLRQSGYFSDEAVSIVESKATHPSFRALGQLEAYGVLIEMDYGWKIREKILLSVERDPIIDRVSREIGIRLVQPS